MDHGLLRRAGCRRKDGPIMDGVQHTNRGKAGQHYTGGDRRWAAEYLTPPARHGRVPPSTPDLEGHQQHGEKLKGIGPENYEFRHVVTRIVCVDRPAYRRGRPGSGRRYTARNPGTPWREQWRSPVR